MARRETRDELAARCDRLSDDAHVCRMVAVYALRGTEPDVCMLRAADGVRVRAYGLGRFDGGYVVVEDDGTTQIAYAERWALAIDRLDCDSQGSDRIAVVCWLRDVVVPAMRAKQRDLLGAA